MKYFIISNKSIVRDQNEDNYFEKIMDEYVLFAVADGIGGLSYGYIASELAIQPFYSLSKPPSSLEAIYQEANNIILKESEQKNRLMGSTLVSAILNCKTNKIRIANVGDSRAYIFTRNGLWHTRDDTLVQELVDMGIITEEQAFDHPNKNRLNKALGTCESIHVDMYTDDLDKDSVLLLCTDGLHDFVRDEDIKSIAFTESPKNAAERLVQEARDNGSLDDITIIIIRNN
jgi:protein phosphatase